MIEDYSISDFELLIKTYYLIINNVINGYKMKSINLHYFH